jgi:hypothetical protein
VCPLALDLQETLRFLQRDGQASMQRRDLCPKRVALASPQGDGVWRDG